MQREKRKTEVWAVKTFGGSSMQKSNFPTTFIFLLSTIALLKNIGSNGLISDGQVVIS